MNITLKKIVLAAALALATPAMAQTFLKPQPMGAKYRDQGAKPATGRAGSAAIEARALLGADGTTDLEVTTGRFEGGSARGDLAKVQVKLLAPNGAVMQTDNYRKSLTGAGFASFSYDNLHRGQPAQVQANVTGIDGNRTDIVTVSTDVKLRPDLVAGVNSQAVATVDSMVVVSGMMTEMNGDVGARATCRLLVDGVEAASIPGAWVDADSAVTCRFQTSFATTGTKRLTVRITDVSPGDFDSTNNEATRSIDVVPPRPFPFMYGSVFQEDGYARMSVRDTFFGYDGWYQESSWEIDGPRHSQSFVVNGWFDEPSPIGSGRITLRHATGSTVIPMITVNVAELPMGWQASGSWCRNGEFPGIFVYICSDPDYGTDVYVGRDAGDAVYTVSGQDYGWLNLPAPEWVALGSSYRAELRYEVDGIAHVGQIEVPLVQRRWVQDDAAFECSYYFYPVGYTRFCTKSKADVSYITGEAYVY